MYAYTGDVKKLKPNGWTFQKLYARNYKTYHNGNIIMYVVSKMVLEIDNVSRFHQEALIDFILEHGDKPKSFWYEEKRWLKGATRLVPKYVLSNVGVVRDRDTHQDLWVSANKEFWNLDLTDDKDKERVEEVLERKYKTEGGLDPFVIGWNTVKRIVKLNEMGPLKKVSEVT